MPRRLLRYFLIGSLLLVLGGLWAFSFFLFNPFEGGYGYEVSTLIPREVDFYLSKKDLSADFDPFPRPAFLDRFEASPSGQATLALGARELVARYKVKESLAELDAALAQLPVRVDPLGIFGGSALALAGNFRGNRLADVDWAVYGRTSWLGKLAVELVASRWVDLSGQGLQVAKFEPEGETLGVTLSGGRLPRPLTLARIRDVVIVATSGELVRAARAFEASRGQDSFGLSAKYGDNIVRPGRTGQELELYLDQRALAENLRLPGTWPDPRSPFLSTALVAKLFQVGVLRELIGTLDLDRTVTCDVVGELSSNVLTPFQQRLYEERGFDKAQMLEVAKLVPADAGVFLYLHADIGDLLRELRSSVMATDPEAVNNLEDVVRAVWNYPDLDPLIDELDAAFRDRVALFVRKYDWAEEEGDNVPPHDSTPVPAWGLILWPQDTTKVEKLAKAVQENQAPFLIRGIEPGSNGVWENKLAGGVVVYEYWNQLVPGTGHVASVEFKGRDPYLVLSNENRLLGQLFKAYMDEGREGGVSPRLSENPAFVTWASSGLPSANALLWLDPRSIAPALRRISDWQAERRVGDLIEWKVERPRIEREVLAKNFPEEKWGSVSPENEDSYQMLLKEELDRFEARFKEQHLPELRAGSERWLQAAQGVNAAFFELSSDRKRLKLHGRVGLSFEPEG